jgi:precorrin-6A/cobalt-precorrin-6A reductase
MAVRGGRLWLFAGTGEGPQLARHFLERGWRLRVSVVTPSAGASYPIDPNLEVVVGALAGAGALDSLLDLAEQQGDPFAWVIDASHPFATRVTAAAVEATRHRPEGFLRLQRPILEAPMALLLGQMGALSFHLVGGERLLLAIGARHLREACQQCTVSSLQAKVLPHARVLPHPQALKQALQAGLEPSRLACLHPTADGAVEEALCHHWQIDTILCRQSGGPTEALWQRIASKRSLRLLLLQRPPEPEGIVQLPLKVLVDHVGGPAGAAGLW